MPEFLPLGRWNQKPPSDIEPKAGTLQSRLLTLMRRIRTPITAEEWGAALDGHGASATRLLIHDLANRGFNIEWAKSGRRRVFRLSDPS